MTLKQIYERLHLFPEYLRYLLHTKYPSHWSITSDTYTAEGLMRVFRKTGLLFHNQPPPMTFDQWLYQNNHADLVEMFWVTTPKFPAGEYHIGIDPYRAPDENGNFVYDENNLIVWQKDIHGKWIMSSK